MTENSLSTSESQKETLYDGYSDTTEEYGRRLSCSWLPCCMDDEEADAFGHYVSIFMVALVAFATFFCVTLILVLVFILG